MSAIVVPLQEGSIFDEDEPQIEARETEVVTGPWGDIPAVPNDSCSITFDRYELINLWELKVIPDNFYVYCCIKYDMQHFSTQAEQGTGLKNINFEQFAERWATPEDDKGKQKKLTPAKIQKAIASFYESVVEVPKEVTIKFFG